MGKSQVYLVKSSTIVRKYLKPSMDTIEQGPQISKCSNSKA